MNPDRLRNNWRTARRFRSWTFLYYYAHGKLAFDPAYPAVLAELRDSPLPLLDLGCGAGFLAAHLRAGGFAGRIHGVDADAGRIAVATRAVGDARTTFTAGDARDFPPHAGNVVMLDAIHYFDDGAQRKLLGRIAASVAPGGVALLRLAVNEKNWRFLLTKWEEWWIQSSRWIPVGGWNFPTREEVTAPFAGEEFSTTIRPMWGLTPFNSYLFAFRRRGGADRMEKET